MSTEDVIELGSSDDEKEPAQKKKKSTANAMVHIPNPCSKLPGITITPTRKVATPKVSNLLAGNGKVTDNKIKTAGKTHLSNKIKIGNLPTSISIHPHIKTKFTNKQLEIRKREGMPCVTISEVHTKTSKNFINKSNLAVQTKGVITHGSKILKNLPAGITIKRANLKRNPLHTLKNKKKVIKESSHAITPTVEIEDEEAPSGSVALWYKRPEEEEESKNEDKNRIDEKVSMEEQNNSEPDVRNFVEITIEDSPIKPDQSNNNMNACVIIEDSPVKAALDKAEIFKSTPSDKQSRKKLNYPQKVEIVSSKEMIEIEVNLMENNKLKNTSNECTENKSSEDNNTKEKDISVEHEGHLEKETKLEAPVEDLEFHPVYQNFIDTCLSIENSLDMQKIVEKKIKAYYKQCPKEFVLSEEFIDLVSGKIIAIEASPHKMYLYIKDVVDELHMQRKLAKATDAKKCESQTETKEYKIDETRYDRKRPSQIRKLEKTLKKLHMAIQKLEEQEVDFEDEDDSVYILTERYKERLVKVHAKFCQLTNSKMPSEPRIKLDVPPGEHSGPTKRLEKLINKKVPIGALLPFPDFHDVLQCVRDANEEDKLHLSEMEMIEKARSLFISCGKKLQRRRQENEWRIAASRIPINTDPAENDENLKKVLEHNSQLANKRESEVFDKYVDRQVQLKLVAEEIGDKEAEESPPESEEEEIDQSDRQENKKKRRERLKRLLQEKSNADVEKAGDQISVIINDGKPVDEKVEESITEGNNETELHTVNDDDKSKIESDVDEMHLLQKLYSESEVDSSESLITLSDSDDASAVCTRESRANSYDITSLENLSFSESEDNIDDLYPNSLYVQDCSTLDESSKNTQMVEDVDTNRKDDESLITNGGIGKSVEVSALQVVNSAPDSKTKILGPSVINIPAGSIREGDEGILLELSDDDNDSATFKQPNNASSIESTETLDKHVGAGPLDATKNVSQISLLKSNDQSIQTVEETSKNGNTCVTVTGTLVSSKCD